MEIEGIRLKDYLHEPIDLLKLDIEGAEYEVLNDCRENLTLVKNIFIEYHGYFNKLNELNKIFDLLYNNNFSYYIKEATEVYPTPFYRHRTNNTFDIQLNIFCFKI